MKKPLHAPRPGPPPRGGKNISVGLSNAVQMLKATTKLPDLAAMATRTELPKR